MLTFSLVAMTWADCPHDKAYTYGYMTDCILDRLCDMLVIGISVMGDRFAVYDQALQAV